MNPVPIIINGVNVSKNLTDEAISLKKQYNKKMVEINFNKEYDKYIKQISRYRTINKSSLQESFDTIYPQFIANYEEILLQKRNLEGISVIISEIDKFKEKILDISTKIYVPSNNSGSNKTISAARNKITNLNAIISIYLPSQSELSELKNKIITLNTDIQNYKEYIIISLCDYVLREITETVGKIMRTPVYTVNDIHRINEYLIPVLGHIGLIDSIINEPVMKLSNGNNISLEKNEVQYIKSMKNQINLQKTEAKSLIKYGLKSINAKITSNINGNIVNVRQRINTIRQLINKGLTNINSYKRYKNSLRTILSTQNAQNAGLSGITNLLNKDEHPNRNFKTILLGMIGNISDQIDSLRI